jgi:hypothetical protein
MSLMDILNQALSGNANTVQDHHLDQIAHHASPDVLGKGLAETFRSDQTPPIGDMVSSLFGKSNGQQQAGMLNQVLATVGPTLAATLAGGLLSKMLQPGTTQVSPAQASKLSPDQVREVVNAAHQKDPSTADALGSFYAQHSGLIKTMGGAALIVALAKMKKSVEES